MVIERIYYSHLIGDVPAFEQAVPRSLVQDKVRKYLKQSVALERIWGTPVTPDMLRSETARIEQSTRMPWRLRELHAALEFDSVVIQECLARPAVVERLARAFFATDDVIHAQSRRRIEQLRDQLAAGHLDPLVAHPLRTVGEVAPAETYKAGEIGSVVEERDRFLLRVALGRRAGQMLVATYAVEKVGWDLWWQQVQGEFDETAVSTVAIDEGLTLLPVANGMPPCEEDDTWHNGTLDAVPDGRRDHTAVWTGSEMIIWGGIRENSNSDGLRTGGRYDPTIDRWLPVSLTNAPAGRSEHVAVWTGSEMLIWGGGWIPSSEGGRYNPLRDSWSPITTVGAPPNVPASTAVWTGSEMIVWGGGYSSTATDDGGRYNPTTDSWVLTSQTNAPVERRVHTAVWTGSEMIVWGGWKPGFWLGDGGRYNPSTDTWATMSTAGGTTTAHHVAVWTGSEMIVWGGGGPSSTYPHGARYVPDTDRWYALSTVDAPVGRANLDAVWTGTEMIVWGGAKSTSPVFDTGGRYDPAIDAWTPTSTVNAPAPRFRHTMIWTGGHVIVWGGTESPTDPSFDTGGRYDPVSDSWTPTFTTGAPIEYDHPSAWTGSLLVVWGQSGTGTRYDPTLDLWTPTSGIDSPGSRAEHSVLWADGRVVVWGGRLGTMTWYSTGAIYDPVADRWRPTSTVNAPDGRGSHTAVWTGDEMIVWGGRAEAPTYFNDGGRYEIDTDSWTPITLAGAPSGRWHHSAVWTGSEMIVWGGDTVSVNKFNTGGRYDPGQDTWSPTSLTDVPSERAGHSAVWTGSEMIVWGGGEDGGFANTGGRYDPLTDSWQPTSLTDAPSNRAGHTAVWSGSKMIVWAGTDYDFGLLNNGGRYSPQTDSWVTTATNDAPLPRKAHEAHWTGSYMLLWGGSDGSPVRSGGQYALGHSDDDDGDGLSDCDGDCNDADPLTFPGADEICDGEDNNCDGAIDDGLDADADGTADCFDNCPAAANPNQDDGDSDLVGDICDNCPDVPNTDQADIVHPNGVGDACDDPDGDGVVDLDDLCPDIANPLQSEVVACILLSDDEGPCVEAEVDLLGDQLSGEVQLFNFVPEPIESITFEILTTTCGDPSGMDLTLNGTLLEQLTLDPSGSCTCNPGIQLASETDSSLLQSIWAANDSNVFQIDVDGVGVSLLSWVRATFESSSLTETVCLWDYLGGDCTEENLCSAGATSDPLSEQVTVLDPLVSGFLVDSTPYSNSDLPESIDIVSLPDERTRLCITASGVGSDCVDFIKQGEQLLVINSPGPDDDDDGVSLCNGDCDDMDPSIYRGAPEINDGKDNQCPGDHGYGVIDEISGICGFHNPNDKAEFSWTAQEGATSYEVVRSSLPNLSGDCITVTRTETYWSDVEDPFQTVCHYYLVRALTPHLGSWGQDSTGIERTNICP
jgi:N-acetylneuraminic acid mutarotase